MSIDVLGYWIRLSESVKGGFPPFFASAQTKAYDSFLSLLHPCVRLKTAELGSKRWHLTETVYTILIAGY